MKKLFAMLSMCLLVVSASAQVSKNYVLKCAKGDIKYTYVEPEKKQSAGKGVVAVLGALLEASAGAATTTQQHPNYVDAVSDAITGAIGRARRIRVVDGKFEPGELAENEAAIYFDGSISSISTTRQVRIEEKDGKKREYEEYRASITGTINIKDARTDVVVYTFNLNNSDWSSWMAQADKAIGYTITNMCNYITNSLNLAYPLYASVIEGNTAKKDKQKEVYIDLGTNAGAFKGMTFHVYSIKTIAGKEAKKEVGRLRITEVMGDDISLCKVTKGGVDIKDAIDAGETLLITSSN